MAQSYNTEQVAWVNYLVRMYENAPFEGVRIVNDYDNQYLLSVVSLEKKQYPNQNLMNRVASVAAMSQANTFINGSHISSEMIITISGKGNEKETEVIERIEASSVGYVQAMEQIAAFDADDGKVVFFYSVKLTDTKPSSKHEKKKH